MWAAQFFGDGKKYKPVCGDDLGDGVWHVVHHISMDSNIDSNIVNQR
jgi:hypothetical protein